MINHITIHGRLTREPELKTTQSGISVCKFSVAVDRSFTKQGEEKQTDFFNVTAWRGLADMIAKYFTKGKEILVSGSMQMHTYDDKDGNKRTAWELLAESVDFCGSKGDSTSSSASTSAASTATEGASDFTEIDDSKLPF